MEQIPKSGFYYPNKLSFIALKAYEEEMGIKGLNTILDLAGLSHLIKDYPPNNLEREFEFADFTAIHLALEEMYGSRGSRGLALRAGNAMFNDFFKNYGAMAGVSDIAFKKLPLQAKLRIGLPTGAKLFTQIAGHQSTITEKDNEFLWTIHRCPICWDRKGQDKPVCYLFTGFLQGMLSHLSGGLRFRINELKCKAMGEAACEFVIQKEPIN